MNDKKTETTDNVGNIDLSEKGRSAEGKPVALDRRLFMQFMVYRNVNIDLLVEQFENISAQAVIYQDLSDSKSIGIMVYCENPSYIVDQIQPILNRTELAEMEYREEFTMVGRTYSIGYEADLEDVLISRPARRICDKATPWAVYYPVRRSGSFERQPREEQRKMLMEHGGIGHAYGKAGFATDIRLAGHGLNKDDNDFIIGLLGQELFPLSALVQHMRRTRQTSEFIEKMGPFFVGRALWQPDFDENATLI
ncbi:MAG: chlorite dismutase family protein [Mariniblastus sp.]|nr:chlorite dismutase family protein [Mariniblastus sp.]